MHLIFALLVGLAAGWIASQIMKSPRGMVGNLVVGVDADWISQSVSGAYRIPSNYTPYNS